MNPPLTSRGTFRIYYPAWSMPGVRGVIERRILVNFRCDPAVIAKLLPEPFRPKCVGGYAVAGICLIRLGAVRPAILHVPFGLASENAAHRIAVEWDEAGAVREGVFIPRRDTNSCLNRLAGGRIFPGVHHAATFQIVETSDSFKLEMLGKDGGTSIRVEACLADELPPGSVFRTLEDASRFFLGGALGWSARLEPGQFDGLELNCDTWRMEPLVVGHVESSFFSDPEKFPPGAAAFDSAFLMRGIAHEWIGRGRMQCEGGTTR
jgi:hypothetical protein